MGIKDTGKDNTKVVRPAVDYDAVKLLRDNPKDYFEEKDRPTLPFGFTNKD